jgi:flagellar motor switch protein FliG
MSNKKESQGIKVDGMAIAAEMLNGLDPEHRKKLLDQMAKRDPNITQKIQKRMFGFEELIGLEDHDFQLLLREIPNSKLVMALRRATPELLTKIYRNMSARAGEILKEEVDTQGPKRVSDIVAAQADILKIALRLEAEGKIRLRHS